MRIAYIAAGAGAMYCGACHRDAALFRALRAAGHELLAIPLYTPLRTDQPVTMAPVFLGGISLYLSQALGLFRRLPGTLRRQLDRPALLRGVSRLSVPTDPAKLGPLTVGMLKGMEGPHAGEMRRLVDFLRQDFRPDIVNLSNSLLAALAPPLRAALGVPIVSTLQGEESFIEALPEPHRVEALRLLRQHARSIDRFVCCAAERVLAMATFLDVPAERFSVIPTGLDPAPFAPPHTPARDPQRPITLGYLSSIRREKGLDLLLESLQELVVTHRQDVRLAIAGQVLGRAYWRQIRRRIDAANLTQRIQYHGTLDLPAKVRFLHACDLFVMPTRLPESRALAAMEALAAGLPVIAARRGVLPELLEKTGGGMTVEPEDVGALTQGILLLLENPKLAKAFAAEGPVAIVRHYSPEAMARQTIEEYSKLLPDGARATEKTA